MTYEIIIGADGSGDHPSFAILTDAKAALESIGFTLEINDVTDSNIMWDALNAGTAEMWAAAWQATVILICISLPQRKCKEQLLPHQ